MTQRDWGKLDSSAAQCNHFSSLWKAQIILDSFFIPRKKSLSISFAVFCCKYLIYVHIELHFDTLLISTLSLEATSWCRENIYSHCRSVTKSIQQL